VPRAGLNRGLVVEHALAVVDEGGPRGFETLSLSAVAARTGVAVPSLYKHVGSLEDLKTAVATVAVRELAAALAGATIGLAKEDALRALAGAYREFARRAPGRYAATQRAAGAGQEDLAQAAAETVAVTVSVLRGFGLPPERSIDAVRVVRSALHGFVVLESGGGFGLPNDLDQSFGVLVDTLVSGIRSLAP